MPASEDAFVKTVVEALSSAETRLPSDVLQAINDALCVESNERARGQLASILKNAELAAGTSTPMCQDTGVPTFFIEVGREAFINFNLNEALSAAMSQAAASIPLRQHSVDPLTRASIDAPLFDVMFEITEGSGISVGILIKGAGSENMSGLAMLSPFQDVSAHILEWVWKHGSRACPPLVLGVGIGSTFDGCTRLAKKALLRSLDETHNGIEAELLRKVNELGIGPMGLGGDTTALHVFVEHAPCHTAMLPVAIAVQCWADRKAYVCFEG